MKILLRTCALLIIGLVIVHITGCSEDATQEIESVAFVSVSPDIGGSIAANGTITLTFDGTPEDVDIRAASDIKIGKTVVSGRTVEIHGPFTQGELNLTVTWLDGRKTLNYTVTAPDPNIVDDTIDTGGGDIGSQPVHTDGQPINVTDATFKSLVLDAKSPVVLEFWAEW